MLKTEHRASRLALVGEEKVETKLTRFAISSPAPAAIAIPEAASEVDRNILILKAALSRLCTTYHLSLALGTRV